MYKFFLTRKNKVMFKPHINTFIEVLGHRIPLLKIKVSASLTPAENLLKIFRNKNANVYGPLKHVSSHPGLEPNTKSKAGTKLTDEMWSQIFDSVAQFYIGLL